MSDIVPAERPSRTSSALIRGAALIKDMGRLRQIASIAARHGLGEVLERLNLQDSAIADILAGGRGKPRPMTTMPVRLRMALQELGPTFVKLGQVMSTRPDLVPAEYVDELKLLQDEVPPVPLEQVRPAIAEAVGKPWEEVFFSFDERPIAAASVAQVYRARLQSGEEVAVKALRPGVRQVVDADIAIMDLLAHRLEAAFAEARALNLSAMVHEFERAMHMELDLRHEARHLARFRSMFEGKRAVRIPKVFPELSAASVLVMELVHGRKITEAAADLPPERRDDLVRVCFDILFTMVLEERVFHGDLHPGNVFLTEDGAVALLDMGLVGRLSPTMRDQVVDVLVALGQGDWNGVAEAFYEMAVRTRPVALRAFVAEVAEVLDASVAGRTLSELELGSVLGRLGELGVRFGMRVPAEYAMMIKAVLTVEGLGRALAPSVNPVEAARPYVEAAIRQRYAPERLGSEGLRALLTVTRTTRELPHALREVLSSVEGGRARVGVDLQTARDLGPTLRAALSPVTDAVLLAGLAVAGALALRHGEAVALGIPMVSLVLFGLGAGVLLRLIFRRRK